MDNIKSALGIGLSAIISSQIYTTFLSSPFTARTVVKEKNQTIEVLKDAFLSLVISLFMTFITGALLNDPLTLIGGSIIDIGLYYLYLWRGGLL